MKTTKLLAYFFSLTAFLLLASPILAATLSLSPSSGTFNRGCTYQVQINLNTNDASTDGTDAILKFNQSVFSVNVSQIANGTIYQEYPGNSVQDGKVIISGLASFTQPYKGTGTLATVPFTVLSTAPLGNATLDFDFNPSELGKTTDSNVVQNGTVIDVLSSAPSGTYTIGTGACTGTGTSTGTGTGTGTSTGTGTGTGTGFGTISQGGGSVASGSAQVKVPYKTLPQGGLFDQTVVLAGVGGILVLMGIVGLALF